jgi:hypothetical protein
VGSSDSLGTLGKTKIATVVDLFPKLGFDYRSVTLGFMAGKVAPGEFFFLEDFHYFPVSIFPPIRMPITDAS